MPAPIVLSPLALRLIAVGGVAAATALLRARRARASVARDAMLDETEEGLALRRERVDGASQTTAEGRWRRIVRLGRRGPGVEVDFSGVIRGRVRPVRRGE